MRVASVCNATETDPRHEDTAQQLHYDLECYLAQIAGVPWIAGGDWNVEPQAWMERWRRGIAMIGDIGGPTEARKEPRLVP